MYQYKYYFTVIHRRYSLVTMSPRSDPTQLLKAMVKKGEESGKRTYPRDEDSNLVVTPQQVLDLLRKGDVTVSFGECMGDPTYDLKVQWGGEELVFFKYEREEWISTYGPCSWNLSISPGEHPFRM